MADYILSMRVVALPMSSGKVSGELLRPSYGGGAPGWGGFFHDEDDREGNPRQGMSWPDTSVRAGQCNGYGISPWRLLMEANSVG